MAKLRHIAITVPDPEKAAKFYMEAFGLKRVGETDWAGASGVYLSDGVVNIALLRYKTEEMAGRRGQALDGRAARRRRLLRSEVPRPRRDRVRPHGERLGRRREEIKGSEEFSRNTSGAAHAVQCVTGKFL